MSHPPWPPPAPSPGSSSTASQYAAPGCGFTPGLSLSPHNAVTHPPATFGWVASPSLPTPMSSNPSASQASCFRSPGISAGPRLLTPRFSFRHSDTSFSHRGNFRTEQSPTGTIGSIDAPIRPGSINPAISPGVTSAFEENSSPIEGSSCCRPVGEVDLTHFISYLRGLISKAEQTVSEILNLVKLKPEVSDNSLACCPFNRLHCMPSEALFQHSLTCSLPPKKVDSDLQAVASSLRYPHTFKSNNFVAGDPDPFQSNDTSEITCKRSVSKKDPRPDGDDVHCQVFLMGITERGPADSGERTEEFPEATNLSKEMLINLKEQSDLLNSNFFYKDTPAVVQVPALPVINWNKEFLLPSFSIEENWAEIPSWRESNPEEDVTGVPEMGEASFPCDQVTKSLLPSRYWHLKKEMASWKDLPWQYTSTLLEAAMALGRVKRSELRKWLLINLPAFGIVPDKALANHIVSLLVFCLRAVQREAANMFSRLNAFRYRKDRTAHEEEGDGKKFGAGRGGNSVSHCLKEAPIILLAMEVKGSATESNLCGSRILFDSGCWMSSQLSPLCDASSSKALVLGMYKQALERASHFLAFSCLPSDAEGTLNTSDPGKVCMQENIEEKAVKCEVNSASVALKDGKQVEILVGGSTWNERVMSIKGVGSREEMESDRTSSVEADGITVAEGSLSLWQMAAAVAALQERAAFEQYRKAEYHLSHLPRFQLSSVHNSVVKRAEEERTKRTNYRAVLEHDGLIWHHSQYQNDKKNKTREEILAEERDYKRRRMSYRGKKAKRTPAQVVHDIIEGHMQEIIAAGGIGCFGKRLTDLPTSHAESEPIKAVHASYSRSDFSVVAESATASSQRGRKSICGDDWDLAGSKETSNARERSCCSTDAHDKELHSSRSYHTESTKYLKHGSRGSYYHYHSDESHRHDSGRSGLGSYSSIHRDHHSHDDRYDSHGRRRHEPHGRSSHDRSDDNSFGIEQGSGSRYDRWESKFQEDRDEHMSVDDQRHRSRHRSRAGDGSSNS